MIRKPVQSQNKTGNPTLPPRQWIPDNTNLEEMAHIFRRRNHREVMVTIAGPLPLLRNPAINL